MNRKGDVSLSRKPSDQPVPAGCGPDQGVMPRCAPLAVPYVPFQQEDPERYGTREALCQGTLYPSLNLPFHLRKNGGEIAKSPLTELQALSFVVHELGLYLDTHADDKEAFALFRKYVELEKSARKTYLENNGPQEMRDAAKDSSYTWVSGKWPWEVKR